MDLAGLLYSAILFATVWATVVCVGIAVPPRHVLDPVRRPAALVRVVLVSSVAIPLFVRALSVALAVEPGAAAGLLLMGAAAAGPLSLKLAELTRGDRAFATALVVTLEVLNVISIPLWTTALLPQAVAPPVGEVLRGVGLFVVLPLGAGWLLAGRVTRPERLVAPLQVVSSVGFVVVLVLTIARNWTDLAATAGSAVPVIAILTILAGLGAGWAVGGNSASRRTAAALVTGVRASALALAIAGTVFAGVPGVSAAVVVFGLASILIPSVAALALARGGIAERAFTRAG